MARTNDGAGTNGPVKRVLREVNTPELERGIHPALIPGIGVEQTGRRSSTNVTVFLTAGVFVAAVIIWAIVSPASLQFVGSTALDADQDSSKFCFDRAAHKLLSQQFDVTALLTFLVSKVSLLWQPLIFALTWWFQIKQYDTE